MPARNRRALPSNQALDDHHVVGSTGSVGDAYDNALTESFVDTFKTELIADRVWRTQPKLAIVEWVAWFNNDRPQESLATRRLRDSELEQYGRSLPFKSRVGTN